MGLHRSKFCLIFLLIITFISACSSSLNDGSLAAQGETLFVANCIACHPTDTAQPHVGPNLIGLASRLENSGQDSASSLKESIQKPGDVLSTGYQDLMPPANVLGLTDEDIDALIVYLINLTE